METHLQELRFAKERQWAVAIPTITFIAGAFHMAHTLNKKLPLRRWEQGREFDRKSVARQFQRLGQVDDLMSVDTEDHLLLTRQLDDEFQFLAGRMHQLDSHIALDLGNFSEIATQETKAQQVERSR